MLIKSIAKLGDALKLPLSTERLNKLTENYIVDNTKLKKALGKEFPACLPKVGTSQGWDCKNHTIFLKTKNNNIPHFSLLNSPI